MHLIPPTSYQGGKVRIATKIVDILFKEKTEKYCDLCCGSGAVSIELINRGVSPESITMLDAGPWGLVWWFVGNGNFPLDTLEDYISKIPKDLSKVKPFMEDLSKQDADADAVILFLLLQAASFGSKPIWLGGNKRWKNTSFRSYWKPTTTSKRRSPVNPMMPMPATLLKRMSLICERMQGVRGKLSRIEDFVPSTDALVYIDPPYKDRTGYGYSFDVVKYAKSLKNKCFVSEGRKLSENAVLIETSQNRKKGGIQGNKKVTSNEEWLNIFNAV